MEQLFNIDLSVSVYVASAVALIAAAVILLLVLPQMRRVRRAVAADESEADPDAFRPVSVIVVASGNARNLETFLPQLLSQDYPAPYEVIVVDDGDEGMTETVVSRLQQTWSNLYMTFAPDGSRNLSRRKLAITLGVKAARYDSLMLTRGNCRLLSDRWLRCMARHFAMGKEVVIGCSVPVPGREDSAPLSRTGAFDVIDDAVAYLSAALAGHPYRGDGNNLGYTRPLFYDQNGFSKTLNLVNGDDDIFISAVARRRNTAVELSPDAFVENRQSYPAIWLRNERAARRFTLRRVRRNPSLRRGLVSTTWWLWLAATVAAIVLGLPSVVPAIAMAVIWILLWTLVMVFGRKTARALMMRPLCLTLPWLYLTAPIRRLFARLRRSPVKHYTYQN